MIRIGDAVVGDLGIADVIREERGQPGMSVFQCWTTENQVVSLWVPVRWTSSGRVQNKVSKLKDICISLWKFVTCRS